MLETKNLTKQKHCTKGIPNSYQHFSLFFPADTLGKATIISLWINNTISQLVSPALLTCPLSFSLFSIMEPGSILNYNYDHVTPLQKIVPLFCILVRFCHITIPSLSDFTKRNSFHALGSVGWWQLSWPRLHSTGQDPRLLVGFRSSSSSIWRRQ